MKSYLARTGFQKTGCCSQQGGLSAARGPNDANKLACLDFEAGGLHDVSPTERNSNLVKLEGRWTDCVFFTLGWLNQLGYFVIQRRFHICLFLMNQPPTSLRSDQHVYLGERLALGKAMALRIPAVMNVTNSGSSISGWSVEMAESLSCSKRSSTVELSKHPSANM